MTPATGRVVILPCPNATRAMVAQRSVVRSEPSQARPDLMFRRMTPMRRAKKKMPVDKSRRKSNWLIMVGVYFSSADRFSISSSMILRSVRNSFLEMAFSCFLPNTETRT